MNAIKEVVQQKYGEAALQARQRDEGRDVDASTSACCGTDPITSNLYDEAQAGGDPGGGDAGVTRVRQPDRARRAQGR